MSKAHDNFFDTLTSKTGLKRSGERMYGGISFHPNSNLGVTVKKSAIEIYFETYSADKDLPTADLIDWADKSGLLNYEVLPGVFFELKKGAKNKHKVALSAALSYQNGGDLLGLTNKVLELLLLLEDKVSVIVERKKGYALSSDKEDESLDDIVNSMLEESEDDNEEITPSSLDVQSNSTSEDIEIHGLGCELVIKNLTQENLKELVSHYESNGTLDLEDLQEITGENFFDNPVYQNHLPLVDHVSLKRGGKSVEFTFSGDMIVPYDPQAHWSFGKPFDMCDQEIFGNDRLGSNCLVIMNMEKGHWSTLELPGSDFDIRKLKFVSHDLECDVDCYSPAYGYEYDGSCLNVWEVGICTTVIGFKIIVIQEGDVVVSSES